MKRLKQAGDFEDRHRAPAQKCRVNDLLRPPGRGHRQEGRRHRKAAQAGGQADELGSRDQHRRGPQARGRRDAGRRVHRSAARAPRGVPARDEARGAVGDAPRRRGHPHQLLGPAGRRGNRASRMVPRGPRAAAYACAPTSIMASPPRTPPMALAASRFGSSRARSSSTIPWPRTSAWPRPTIPPPIVRAASRASANAV